MLSVVVTLTDAGTAVVCRSFFVKGRQFRQPAYLATSFSEAVARGFLASRGGAEALMSMAAPAAPFGWLAGCTGGRP